MIQRRVKRPNVQRHTKHNLKHTNLGVVELLDEVLGVDELLDEVADPEGAPEPVAAALIGRRANLEGGRRDVVGGRELPVGGLVVRGSEI